MLDIMREVIGDSVIPCFCGQIKIPHRELGEGLTGRGRSKRRGRLNSTDLLCVQLCHCGQEEELVSRLL